jgi:hypothetical protein
MLVDIVMNGRKVEVFGWALSGPSLVCSSGWTWLSLFPHTSETQWVSFPASVDRSDFERGRNLRPIKRSQVYGVLITQHHSPPRRANRSPSQSGVQRSQNMFKKFYKHILKLAQKKLYQHKFEFFDTCWPVPRPEPQRPVKPSLSSRVPCLPLHQQIKHNPRKVGGFAGVGQ